MPRVIIGGVLPTTISSLIGWFKADSIVGANDGDLISTWNDSSALANTLTQSGAARPTYKTSIINSLPILRFAGAQSILITSPTGVNSQTFTYIVVAKPTHLAGSDTMIANGADNGSRQFAISSSTMIFNKSNMVALGADSYVIPDITSFRIFMASYDSTSGRLSYRINGLATNTFINSQTFIDGRLIIGQMGTGEFFNGDIAEVLMFSAVLSESDRTTMEQYLAKKYNSFGITTSRTLVT